VGVWLLADKFSLWEGFQQNPGAAGGLDGRLFEQLARKSLEYF